MQIARILVINQRLYLALISFIMCFLETPKYATFGKEFPRLPHTHCELLYAAMVLVRPLDNREPAKRLYIRVLS